MASTISNGASRWLPLLRLVGDYRRSWLRSDVLAGVSVCVIMIPSVIAYAELAGLPPAHGLYAAPAAMVGHCLFASSRKVVAGPDTQTVPGMIAYRYYAPLFFANADYFVQRVRDLVSSSPTPVRWFLLDMQAVWDIDISASEAVSRLKRELRQKGIVLKIARANRSLRDRREHVWLADELGAASYYPSVHAAVEAFQQQQSGNGAPDER